jgi:Domain of Unknown Function (DUF1080)
MKKHLLLAFAIATTLGLNAQVKAKPEDTEYYTPVPNKVTPAKGITSAPSDAIVLFNGTNMDEWQLENNPSSDKKWDLVDGAMRVSKTNGDLLTKRKFMNFQLHIEYNIPSDITGSGQARGNSGIFLAGLPKGIGNAGGYELQVLDNYTNTTYVNGQVGSIYKQNPPLVNAALPAGEWQTYDVIWTAPLFNEDGSLKSAARITVFHNGILVQNDFVLKGDTPYIGQPVYVKHGASPIKLQAHGDKSEPLSYRNIWVRPL